MSRCSVCCQFVRNPASKVAPDVHFGKHSGSDRQGKSNVAANKLPLAVYQGTDSQEWSPPLNTTPDPTDSLLFSGRLRRWRLRRRGLLRRRRWLLRRLLRRRRSRRLLLRRRRRELLKDGSARRGADGWAQAQRNRCSHEHDRAPSGGLTEKRRRAARAEGSLATGAAKRPRQVRRLAALQQHDDNQQETHQNVDGGQQERHLPAHQDQTYAHRNRDGPLNLTRHCSPA